MSRVIRDIQTDSVTASLQFSATTDDIPVVLVSKPNMGLEKLWPTAEHDVVIDDARAMAEQLDLDRKSVV